MQKLSSFTILLSTFLACGCDNTKFAEAESGLQTYQVKIQESPDDTSTMPPGGADSVQPNTSTTDTTSLEGGGDAEAGSECAKQLGVGLAQIKVAGSQKDIIIGKQDALAFKVTGNKNRVAIDLTNVAVDSEIKGICIFVAGNQNLVHLQIANHVKSIFVKARGNQPVVTIDARKGSVIDSIEADSKGNKGSLTVSGEGSYKCDKNSSTVTCK